MCHATIRIPESLRPLAGGNGQILVDGETVAEALAWAYGTYEALMDRIRDGNGSLRPRFSLLLGETDIRQLDGPGSRLRNGDVLTLVENAGGPNRGAGR